MQEQTGARRLRGTAGGRRRKQQSARELLRRIADSAPPEGTGRDDLGPWADSLGHPLSVYEAILVTQAAQALEGDLKSAQFVRDTLGDKPGDQPPQQGQALSPAEKALMKKVAVRLGVSSPAES